MLKTFSQTLVKDLWLLAHDLLRTQWKGPLPVKIEGRWAEPEPQKWPRRRNVFVKPGMSPGERQRRVQALGALIGFQTTLAKEGMEACLSMPSGITERYATGRACRISRSRNST